MKDQDILKRLRFPGVEDYEYDPGVCKAAADHIEALRRMVETRDLLISDLEREIRELRAANDRTWNEAVEAALLKLPGGNYCDPQEAADEIRQIKINDTQEQP